MDISLGHHLPHVSSSKYSAVNYLTAIGNSSKYRKGSIANFNLYCREVQSTLKSSVQKNQILSISYRDVYLIAYTGLSIQTEH